MKNNYWLTLFVGLGLSLLVITVATKYDSCRDSRQDEAVGLLSLKTSLKDLYLMKSSLTDNVYKIGMSNNPERRVKEIDRDINGKTDGDVQLVKVWPNVGHLESQLHKMFREENVFLKYHTGESSTEWFRLSQRELCSMDEFIMSNR